MVGGWFYVAAIIAIPSAAAAQTKLPETIPIFPLEDVMLFPGMSVPLHIFEPRYKAMIADALIIRGFEVFDISNPAKPVIVHCGDGNRAGGGVALLRKGGFANVVNLSGGYAAWQQAGLPVEK